MSAPPTVLVGYGTLLLRYSRVNIRKRQASVRCRSAPLSLRPSVCLSRLFSNVSAAVAADAQRDSMCITYGGGENPARGQRTAQSLSPRADTLIIRPHRMQSMKMLPSATMGVST